MEIIHLESGTDLEKQLRRLQLRRKRRWYNRISRKTWAIIGATLGVSGCGLLALVLSRFVSFG